MLHHPLHQHPRINDLQLSPFKLENNVPHSDYMYFIVHTSEFIYSKKPKHKEFSPARMKRIENILFAELRPNGSFKYLMNLLDDVGSFHLVMVQKVGTLEEVNKSLQDFLPLNEKAAKRVDKIMFSIPETWTYFRFVCFSKLFFKNNNLDCSSWLLCHCLGIIDVHELTGSIAQTKQNAQSVGTSQVKCGKRMRNFDSNVRKKLEEIKKKKSHVAYLMHRVSMSRGRQGDVIGVIDGGSDNNMNGIPCQINSFSIRFLVDQACNTTTQHYESMPYSLDQVAIGLVRAKNKGRGGRCKIPLDDIAWNTGSLQNGLPLLEMNL